MEFFFWTGLATLAVWLFVWNESHHRKARRQDEARRRRMEADYQQHKRRAAEIWNEYREERDDPPLYAVTTRRFNYILSVDGVERQPRRIDPEHPSLYDGGDAA